MSPSAARTVLLLAAEDVALTAAVQSACSDCAIESGRFQLETWLQSLYGSAPAGAVLDTDRMSLADLHGVAATRRLPSAPWLLLLTGDRGLAGCERLIADRRTAILPKPWTTAGIQAAIQRVQPVLLRGEGFPGDFLEGMVEGLRDPLASLSGYLQLLGAEAGDAGQALLDPAMAAAADLEAQLSFTRLAARPPAPHVERIGGDEVVELLMQDAAAAGVDAQAKVQSGLVLDADPRALRAAMATGRRLLSRFGPGGRLTLELAEEADGIRLGWSSAISEEPPADSVAPPPYLPLLFERLATRVPAEALLDRIHDAVPVLAALRWTVA